MAEALVGGAFLSGFINVVFDRLLSPEAANLILGKKLDQELVERMKSALCAAEALLLDAEMKQFHDKNVKIWLNTLRDAVYVADDLLDHVFTKAATQKEVSNFLSRFSFMSFQDREIGKKMEEIVRKIEDLEKRKYILDLKVIPRENFSWRSPSTSLVGGSIHGRENDQNAIINMLSDDNTDAEVSVISIVGIGGIGKTTLAQLIYNNENFIKEFDVKAWVCVSEEDDILNLTKSILNNVTHRSCDKNDLDSLQLDLKAKLTGKKFLIVLDDVWNLDYDGWKSLRKPFQFGAKGSKILVTTRSKEIATIFNTCSTYFLNELSQEHCWSIFAEHACFPESNGNQTLESIGREIVKKCNGVPLAAETLGSLLRRKHDVKDWNTILTSNVWEFPLKDSKIIPALLLSYHHLPCHLKHCFAHCSLYPKDYHFCKDELIFLWMAEDLLPPPNRGETLEEVGSKCFDDLTSRLFFKESICESFVMHDLLHDLAIFVAGDFYVRLEDLGKADKISIHTRHLSYGGLSRSMSSNFDVLDQAKYVRTFLAFERSFDIYMSAPSFSIRSSPSIIISKLKYLRALSFESLRKLDILPDSIGELIHLRHLNLSRTSIKTLPESLGDLYNLLTLKLYSCEKLIMLPSSIQNLVNLHHLDIRFTKLEEMPPGMSKLNHLQFLSDFVVGKHENNGIKEIGQLSNLHGSLAIRKLENVSDSNEASEASIMDKRQIENLLFEWSCDSNLLTASTEGERDTFDKLQPYTDLKKLRITGYRGTRFPNWVGHSSYHNMTSVSLWGCSNCCMLPSLGQLPSLKSLEIKYFDGLGTIDALFYKSDDDHSLATPFPSLERMSFGGMPCLEEWHSSVSDAFPQLKHLDIRDCPKLIGDLPNHFPALETLAILGCKKLICSLPRIPTVCNLQIFESNEVVLQEWPFSLQSLIIEGSKAVESMFHAIATSQPTYLQYLQISNCSSVLSFPKGCLPESLKKLDIQKCRQLKFPNQQQTKYESLESLILHESCDSLTSLTLEVFPNLNYLSLTECENLESISLSQSQHSSLEYLFIQNCPNFVWFPREGLTAPNMISFTIMGCNKLKWLSSHMSTLLPKLEYLSISDCPEIDSFPDGGLPPNLKSLQIKNCEKLLSGLSSMGVHQGLTNLIIDGASESVNSFPKLPQLPSLKFLSLGGFPSVDTLECKGLLHLTSLQELMIQNCQKLENMTTERLPTSLLELDIYGCPFLEEQCKKKHPQLWSVISHISHIGVSSEWIQ